MEINKLTAKQCDNALPINQQGQRVRQVLLSDGGGLYLQVTESKSGRPGRSWIFRYKTKGEPTSVGLGSLSVVSLAEARRLAAIQRDLINQGKDPLAEKQRKKDALEADGKAKEEESRIEEAKSVTFKKCSDDYIAIHKVDWTNIKHVKQWESTLAYTNSKIGNIPIPDITTDLIVEKVLKPIWEDKNVTAKRLQARIKTVLDYATAKKWRTGDNPADWSVLRYLLSNPTTEVINQPSLDYKDLPAFIVELRKRTKTTAKLLEFIILTAVRRDEARLARWQEFDLERALWVVPACRMKGKKGKRKEHRVPLSTTAVALLRSVKPEDAEPMDYVFSYKTGRPMNKDLPLRMTQEINEEISVHGFRSTFYNFGTEYKIMVKTDGNADEEIYPFDDTVCDLALAHATGDKVKDAYKRTKLEERRKRLMQVWADFIDAPNVTPNVVPFRKVG
jgi:integrase